MIKDFEEQLELYKKGKEKYLALSDYHVLGEELAIIKAFADQLTLYCAIVPYDPENKRTDHIEMPTDTLWGVGQAIIRLIEELQTKLIILDEQFNLEVREEKNCQVVDS